MRTLLSRFCEEFNGVLRPVLKPLERAAEMLGEAAPDTPGREIVPQLVDIRHQIETLADKVEAQQAYVIIFGPLKSGKSTLMNAVSAAYVSEVTSLPAYPCMVYVSHANQVSFKVHRYNGTVEEHKDSAALHMQVNRAHVELAEHIRRVESIHGDEDLADPDSVAFDPVVHFTDAIRRVDVRVPAGHLSQSGAVLVDTPGLYSRMKFGYDRMTREFRNAAACAIFVVKSDNLFLEQVFEEFNQLLELFSRIFLVVNLDTSKVDLRPDGSLEPSLERRDPLRIIEAFENLAMSAPLKDAAEQGRLRIYPVDLLRAASERLQSPEDASDGTSRSEDESSFEGQASFDMFLGDLTEYLNSTEYLVAFLGDSLRQGNTFLGELRELCGQPAVDSLRESLEELEAKENLQRERLASLDRLLAFDWSTPFSSLEQELGSESDVHENSRVEQTRTLLHEAVESWFKDDTSLHTLLAERLAPILSEHRDETARTLGDALRSRVDKGEAGILVPHSVSEDLVATGIHLDQFGTESVEQIRLDVREPAVSPPISADDIPVRKSFWDWILFRSRATVRRRLLGSSTRPDQKLFPAAKQRRLGEVGKERMLATLEASRAEFFRLTHELQRTRILNEYTTLATEALNNRFTAERDIVSEVRRDLESCMKQVRKVLNHVTTLQAETDRALASIDELSSSYGQTDPTLLARPIEEVEREAETLVESLLSTESEHTDEVHAFTSNPTLEAVIEEQTSEPAIDEVTAAEEEPVTEATDAEEDESLRTVELTPALGYVPRLEGTEPEAEDALLSRSEDESAQIYDEALNGAVELEDVDLAPDFVDEPKLSE